MLLGSRRGGLQGTQGEVRVLRSQKTPSVTRLLGQQVVPTSIKVFIRLHNKLTNFPGDPGTAGSYSFLLDKEIVRQPIFFPQGKC